MTQESDLDSWQNKNLFIFFKTFISEMGPTKTAIQKLSETNSSGIKRLVRESGGSSPPGARINECKSV
jgi:hypothetical protein